MNEFLTPEDLAPLITYEDGTRVPMNYPVSRQQKELYGDGGSVWNYKYNTFTIKDTKKNTIPKKYRSMLININFEKISGIGLNIYRSNINIHIGKRSRLFIGPLTNDISLKLCRDTEYISGDNDYYTNIIIVKNAKQMIGTDIYKKKNFVFGPQAQYTLILSKHTIHGSFFFKNMNGMYDKVPLLTGQPNE